MLFFLELGIIILIILGEIFFIQISIFLILYILLSIMGSWIIPFFTSYLVHAPEGSNELLQTRLFRGKFYSIISLEHLYHLEHHLYPMVPHKNWKELARRLDPYFERMQIKANRIL
ncbi:MAG: fatty acid desaturase [Saprospiraceae bacterium]|nr:fatty acid desaturase [Candidatus Brachybacter algidus]MBP7307046.1 fatty acid desaturase [Saprospiraceae bacterium]MBK6448275.1 fatty acid desaturase [Candidatus Brachybacter algidus]MBK7605496.1 fatty acid desaturase [Candidatus Brachybacter algidus]MBK8354238.1 fatty acid desaturase [Candidatus Brachybacter algidus]